jgi:FO synthase subunit 1
MTVVTYSPAYTLVPTYECFNRCTYCNFRADPGTSPWLSLAEAEARLKQLPPSTIEMLILSGEVHPQSDRRSDWVQRLYDLCELSLSLGFLPHTNAGILTFTEMQRLKQVNVSMGLMLEQTTPELLKTVHRHAPSKVPDLRLQQLLWAGELQIPFTTGLLLGIGETAADRIATLNAIAQLHERFGHIQEVILQPYSPGEREALSGNAFQPEQLLDLIKTARQILPESICLQVPPNLIATPEWLMAAIAAGARDLGGISPQDEVNPDYPHPRSSELAALLAESGWALQPRLPVYPQYDRTLLPALQAAVQPWRLATTAVPGVHL